LGVAQVHLGEPSARGDGNPAQADVVQRLEMSDEEKERRREECNTVYEACDDWCKKSNPKDETARWKCRDNCKKKLADCMKKIESNPIEDPDY
jgi:hypothetical protein